MPVSINSVVVRCWMLLALTVLSWTADGRAQEGAALPAPLSIEKPARPAAIALLPQLAARRALEIGLSSVAVEMYQRLLDDPAVMGAARNEVALELTVALLEEDRVSEAGQALRSYSGPPTASVRLRQAMIAARERRFDAARGEVAALKGEALPVEDRAWFYFVSGLLAEETNDPNQPVRFYQQAIEAAISEPQRAWFSLARERVKLTQGEANQKQMDAWAKLVQSRTSGGEQRNVIVGLLAIGYNILGQRANAVSLLKRELQNLPRQAPQNDEWQFLLGLIAGAADGDGRGAFRWLLSYSTDSDKQRASLRLLANASRIGAQLEKFRELLNELIDAKPAHPILGDLLLFRAQAALAGKNDKRYDDAAKDANRLLTEFPGSQLKAAAHGVLATAAWEQRKYRIAANQATQAREALALAGAASRAGDTRAKLGVLVAEAYFRAAEAGNSAAEYRTASDAYGAALGEVPEGLRPGWLMFQRVQSLIKAEALADAQTLLDAQNRDPRFDVISRWQAEWNLARALQAAGETGRALARVSKLFEGETPDKAVLPPTLRAQLAWLQARLSYDAGEFARVVAQTSSLVESLDGVDTTLKTEVASSALLLQIRAGFRLAPENRPADPVELLNKLRTGYPKSDAAVYSYIVEADEAADAAGAQTVLRGLADKFPESVYAPYALYRAALYATLRGQEEHYRRAYNILEDLVTGYAQSDLFFYARLQQGHLKRLLSDHGGAVTIYESLRNQFKFPQNPNALSADLALADTFSTFVATDPSYADRASAIYERLFGLQGAPIDLRVEAGYRFGLGLSVRDPGRAQTVWWQVVNDFLEDPARAEKLGRGRYWMSRTLLDLGGLLDQQTKYDQAKKAYELILSKGLIGDELARERLAPLVP